MVPSSVIGARTGMSCIMSVYSSVHVSTPSASEKSMSFHEIRHESEVTAVALRATRVSVGGWGKGERRLERTDIPEKVSKDATYLAH